MIVHAEHRLPGFDGLRAIAALCIVALHVTGQTGAINRYTARLDIGVAIFFVISGYLLYRPFAASHLGQRGQVNLGRFWSRRALRIFPAYWIALTAAIVLFGSTELTGAWDYIGHYGLVQIYDPIYGIGGIPPAWTLAVEVSFYAALPLYAFLVGRATRRLAVPGRIRAEIGTAIAVYGGALVWRFVLVSERGTDRPATRWLPAMADWFALGILLAVLSIAFDTRRFGDRYAAASVAGAVVAYLAVCNIGLPTDLSAVSVGDDVTRQILYGCFGAFLVLPAALGHDNAFVRILLQHPIAIAVGTVSYGVFLWHYDWLEQLRDWGAFDWFPSIETVSVFVMTLALSLATATLSWIFVERPLLRGRRARRDLFGREISA